MAMTAFHIFLLLMIHVACATEETGDSSPSQIQSSVCKIELERAKESNLSRSSLMEAAVCFHQHNHIEDAMQIYQHIRETVPDYSYVLVNIALIALKKGEPDKVIEVLEVYFEEIGGVYGEGNRLDLDSQQFGPPCTTDSKFKDDCVNALNILGSAHMEQWNYTGAATFFQRAIDIGNDYALREVHSNAGALLMSVGDNEGAADSFLTAFWVSVRSGNLNPSPLIRRAILVPSVPDSLEDSMSFQLSFEDRIRDLITLIEFGGSQLKDDSSDLFRVRSGASVWKDVLALPPLAHTLSDMANAIQTPHFFLHYYGFHDRSTHELVALMYERISKPESLLQIAPTLTEYEYPAIVSVQNAPSVPNKEIFSGDSQGNDQSMQRNRKIRVVFISSLFGGNEPHGLLLIDVIRRLPKILFETIAVGIGKKPPTQIFLDAVSDNYFGVGHNEAEAQKLLSSLRPDCVVFAENVNEAISHFLGFQRFAPIQVLVMGAPVTSGISSIDFFISGDRLEHPFRNQMSGDKRHEEPYTEQVVLFDGQAISFPPSSEIKHVRQDAALAAGDAVKSLTAQTIDGTITRDEYGIPLVEDSAIYLCFQSLFKIHPAFDAVIMKILFADRTGHVVLQASRDFFKTQKVINRLRFFTSRELCREALEPCTIARDILSRIHFIPRVPSDKMSNVFQRGTVVLHPFPFGGSKTAFDALDAGVPLVTYPQKYLRGRMAASFFTTMALHEVNSEISAEICCVASDTSDYITKALRLGQDIQYRNEVAMAIQTRKDRIFDDKQTSFEWARFLTRAMGVVVDTNDLALEMEFIPETWQRDDFLETEMILEQRRWKRSGLVSKALNRTF